MFTKSFHLNFSKIMSPVNTFYFPNIYWHIFKNNVWLMIEKVTYPKTNELNFEVVNQIYYDSFLNIRNSDTWNYWLIHIIEAYSWTYQYICKSVQIPLSLLNFNFNISLSFINSSIYFSFLNVHELVLSSWVTLELAVDY